LVLENLMSTVVRLAACAALLAGLATAACTPVRTHQGYVVDKELVDAIQPGVDNRQSVAQTLGQPTFTSQFNGGEWYYVSRMSSNLGFQAPRPTQQTTLRIRFDAAGNVAAVDRMNQELIANVDPYGKKTPTAGGGGPGGGGPGQ
jgi:outer membrane protein assembly factor BamE (lipoprotein component of BamABCDE complex)